MGGWLAEAADLAHILQRGCSYVVAGHLLDERFTQGFDATAHTSNLLRGPGAVCRGPREYDLAVLASAQPDHGTVALAAYAEQAGTPVPEPEVPARFARARELEAAVWALAMAHLYPARYRDLADELLATVLAKPAS